ncbi:Condensin complex subunit 2 [Candida maltosa Xu316]|uniref:Condensin complex subunit 2 n=1 Tax=Candida maltosa (strain Xu316) TaxID=1245528 RepID=M3IHP7_CANMX|nr:Condensin complex subunit 2 [Candida maltosa Xu316]
MTPQILPKKRGSKQDDRRNNAPATPVRTTPSSNRIISNRVVSNRIMSRPVNRSIAEDLENESFDNNIAFNENKHTIMSNFEEWIKMATDNKITSKNSWNFDLIDYFHDLNVIKDGDNINFQRASATLDGCVKIYSSRVESAATETGKLLSGLAKKKETEGDEDDEGEEGEENSDEEENQNNEEVTKKRKMNRVVESTLVDFETIRIKKLEQELAIDPLFKKALAEFDEGGAKSLLLNTLNIDRTGRVVFDATSNPVQESTTTEEEQQQQEDKSKDQQTNIDITSLERFIYKDDENFEVDAICPSLGEFESALSDVNKAKSLLNDFNNKMTHNIPESSSVPFTPATENEDYGFDDDVNDFGGLDFNDNVGDLDIDIKESDDNLANQSDPFNNIDHSIMQTLFHEATENNIPSSSLNPAILDQDLMAYFDDRMKSNWRGPEHWKVTAFKRANNIDQTAAAGNAPSDDNHPENDQEGSATTARTTARRRRPENVVIDFFNEDFDEDALFEAPKNRNTIFKKNRGSTEEFILPDDIKYNSARLTNLFTKSQIAILHHANRNHFASMNKTENQVLTDENYFAEQYRQQEEEERERLAHSFHQAECEDYDNDFGDVGIDFNDALEADIRETVSESQSIISKRRPCTSRSQH